MDFSIKFETSENIILASGSPRRIEMMEKHGVFPRVIKPEVDETIPSHLTLEQAVMYLSLKKALCVEQQCLRGLIFAADTVVYQDRIIGKPVDYQDAVSILKQLRGQTHLVATGVTILEAGQSIRRTFTEITQVDVKEYTDEEIQQYIATGEPWDKAGGYAIQGIFGKYIDRIRGDYDNVIGFPWSRIEAELKLMGFGIFG